MHVKQYPQADVIALDRDDNPVLLAEVKTRPVSDDTLADLTEYLNESRAPIPFAMTVDPAYMSIYSWDGQRLSEPLCTLGTADVLRHYEPEFGAKCILEDYLATLVEAWLRDLAYRWKSARPPAVDAVAATGLLLRLADGTTVKPSTLDDDPLR